MTQEGFMRYGTEDYDRYTITAKISAQLTKALKVDYSNRWVRTDYERPTYMNDDSIIIFCVVRVRCVPFMIRMVI